MYNSTWNEYFNPTQRMDGLLGLQKEWSRHSGAFRMRSSLFEGHEVEVYITESVKRLATEVKTHFSVISDGFNSELQPLDILFYKLFKVFMHKR